MVPPLFIMKHYFNSLFSLMLALSLTCASFSACSSDDADDFGHKAKNAFVGKSYIEQYILQNTSWEFQHIIHFSTDSTFYFVAKKLETGEYTADPKEGKYKVESDGTITFSGVSRYNTHIWSRRFTLYQAKFKDEQKSVLQVHRSLEFDSGKSRTDWVDFMEE